MKYFYNNFFLELKLIYFNCCLIKRMLFKHSESLKYSLENLK